MRYSLRLVLLFSLISLFSSSALAAGKSASGKLELEIDSPLLVLAQNDGSDDFDDEFDDEFGEGAGEIADPLEPFNRAMFVVNDKLYFWILKPVARGYNYVVPEDGRSAVQKFFNNLRTPIRFVNSILQFKMKKAGTELTRFVINSTIGIVGLMDPARDHWNIFMEKEDTGQTLGFYGLGPGLYLYWPILGPSSLRDTVGFVGDSALDPATYVPPSLLSTGIKAYDKINIVSLNLGVYEDIKKEALDPYVFIRDAYHQHRESKVKE